MADLILKRFAARNWMTIKETEIAFPPSGLVLLSGVVGSGKTGLTEALCRMLFGAVGRFNNFGEYSLDEKGNTYLKLEVEFRGKPLVIESGFCCREMSLTGEALRYSYDGGAPVERSRIAETRSEINGILGISRELAESLICVDGDRLKFNRMGQGDLVGLVMQVLNQPSWDAHYRKALEKLNAFKRDATAETTACTTARTALKSAEDELTQAQEDLQAAIDEQAEKEKSRADSLAECVKQIAAIALFDEELTKQMEDLEHQIKRKEKQLAKEEHEVEIRRNNMDDNVTTLVTQREKLLETKTRLEGAVERAEDAVNALMGEPEFCPKCNKPWDKKHSAEEIEKARKALEAAEAAYEKQATIVKAADADLAAAREKARAAGKELREFRDKFNVKQLSESYETAETQVTSNQRESHRWEVQKTRYEQSVDGSAVASAKSVVTLNTTRVTEAEQAVKTAAEALAETQEGLRMIEYWTKAFSPNGIPNMLLNETVGPLNDVAQRVSHQLGRGMMEVWFSTTKKLVSGEQKPQLNVQVKNRMGSNKANGCSKGESTLTNLVILESLSELGRVSSRVGLRIFDEPFTNADEIVARALYAYLAELAKTSLIFLADHNAVASSYANYILGVTKQAGGTVYAWQ